MSLLIVIPTYNEIDNIPGLVRAVFDNTPPDAAILVVDDNSPDGTGYEVEKISADYPGKLHILHRTEKQGLAAAYLSGFSWGWNGQWEVFLELDADFSHDPKYIPKMLEEIETYDVVIGSRNIKGGKVEGWTLLRNVISKGGSLSDILCKCTASFIYSFLLKKCRFVIPYWARNYKNQEIRNSRKREAIDSFAPEIRQAQRRFTLFAFRSWLPYSRFDRWV